MRHRTDHNQNEIVKALEQIGCTVYKIGRPLDLLVGYRQRCYILEAKSKTGKKTPFQEKFFKEWKGQRDIVRTAEEAIAVVCREST